MAITEFAQRLQHLSGALLDEDYSENNVGWLQETLTLAAIRITEYDDEARQLKVMIAELQQQIADLRGLYDPFLRHFLRMTEPVCKDGI